MPKLVLANPQSRAMVARPEDIPVESRPIYEVIGTRMLWSLGSEDIAVIAAEVDKEFVAYVTATLGLPDGDPTVFSLQDHRSPSWYPEENPELLDELRARVTADGAWTLDCYIRDRDMAHWEQRLGLAAAPTPYAQDLAALVNSKVVFRALALAAGVPVPEGLVVDPGRELIDAVTALLPRTGSVIVKQDHNAGGDGNVLLTTDPSVRGIGVFRTLLVDDVSRAAVAAQIATLGMAEFPTLHPGTAAARLVVEVYQPNALTLSSELYIPAGRAPVLLNYGDMRMEPVWSGYVFPPQDLAGTLHARLCADSQQIAILAQRMGYQGLMNIDAIVDSAGRLTFTEFNGRTGGATNIDIIARRLLGPNFLDEYVIMTRNGLPGPRTAELVRRLERAGLAFDRDARCGVIVANVDARGLFEYMAIGRDRAQAQEIEHALEALLSTMSGSSEGEG
ncbi:peptide ligase PGM1-related protein [Micromonospora peucetia]|uniref:preATP grasp domain-containing protein n=1 Tax=Micromonospora peucetia TaxID=47871 RepID=UPI0033307163